MERTREGVELRGFWCGTEAGGPEGFLVWNQKVVLLLSQGVRISINVQQIALSKYILFL